MTEEGALCALVANEKTIDCQACVLAIGHSAMDTVHALYEKGMRLENKPFPIGVRIEHTQAFINEAMLGDFKDDPRLVPARYTLTEMTSNHKGVYTFCMCPGGYVIPSAAQPGQLVVNGMSYADRAGTNANSALLIQCDASDYGTNLFDGERFVEALERKAYAMTETTRCLSSSRPIIARADERPFGRRRAFVRFGLFVCRLEHALSAAAQCLPPRGAGGV